MTKEELIANYPSVKNNPGEFGLYLFVAAGVIVVLLMIITGVKAAKKGSRHLAFSFLAGSLLVSIIWVLSGNWLSSVGEYRKSLTTSIETYKWHQSKFPEYLETLSYERVEPIYYSFKDGYYHVVVDQKGQPVVLSTSNIKDTRDGDPYVEAKYVEGLSEYGIKDGYRDAVFYLPLNAKEDSN